MIKRISIIVVLVIICLCVMCSDTGTKTETMTLECKYFKVGLDHRAYYITFEESLTIYDLDEDCVSLYEELEIGREYYVTSTFFGCVKALELVE